MSNGLLSHGERAIVFFFFPTPQGKAERTHVRALCCVRPFSVSIFFSISLSLFFFNPD